MFKNTRKKIIKDRVVHLANGIAPVETLVEDGVLLESRFKLDPKLLECGYLEYYEQKKIFKIRLVLILLGLIVGSSLAHLCFNRAVFLLLGGGLGIYFALLCWFIWLASKTKNVLRAAYFDLPLILEELILLVESGLGLFPALEKVCVYQDSDFEYGDPGVCRKSFKRAYTLAVHGMPVSHAFAMVSKGTSCLPLKQVLIHLDVSASIGGELLTSLRSLSDQVHKEWKMQVETRVKRLENIVVFPVFLSVMGLLLLTSAVPLVPVFEFMSGLKKGTAIEKSTSPDLNSSHVSLK